MKKTLILKDVDKFAKRTSHTKEEIRELFRYLLEVNPKNLVTLDLMTRCVNTIRENNWTMFDYLEAGRSMIPKKISKEETKKEITSGKLTKAGYSLAQQDKINKITNSQLNPSMKKLITRYVTDILNKGIGEESEEAEELLNQLDKKWRDYCREYIVKEYPKALTDKSVRERLFGLFITKLNQVIEKKNTERKDVMKTI